MNYFIVKKIFLLSISVLFFACNNSDNENNFEKISIKNTRTSNEDIYAYELFESETYNKIDLNKWFITSELHLDDNYRIKYQLNESNINVPIIYINVKNIHENIIGVIEAISYKNELNITDFNILLRNYENFDLSKGSGKITLIDINSDIAYVEADLLENTIIKIKNNIAFVEGNNKIHQHPMDTNGDGNVTFSECYAYANSACQGDPECTSMCYFWADGVGWVVTGVGPLCQYSIAAACAVVAWNN